jgi:hypothetical protein
MVWITLKDGIDKLLKIYQMQKDLSNGSRVVFELFIYFPAAFTSVFPLATSV